MHALASSSYLLAGVFDELFTLDEDRLALWLVALVFCLAALVFIVAIVSRAIVVHRRNRMENELKREMLERGVPYEDVAAIMGSGRPADKETQSWKPPKS